ncbi:MAG TPA: PAS domain-containing protein [Azospirillum sp.]
MIEPLAALRRFWEGKAAGRPMPVRRDFIAEEFRPWFGHLVIVKVEGEASRFRVTLAGLEVVRYYGRDLTGRVLDDEMGPEGFEWIVATYRECARTARPVYNTTPSQAYNGTVLKLGRILLPCGANGRVDTIVCGIYPAESLVGASAGSFRWTGAGWD